MLCRCAKFRANTSHSDGDIGLVIKPILKMAVAATLN